MDEDRSCQSLTSFVRFLNKPRNRAGVLCQARQQPGRLAQPAHMGVRCVFPLFLVLVHSTSFSWSLPALRAFPSALHAPYAPYAHSRLLRSRHARMRAPKRSRPPMEPRGYPCTHPPTHPTSIPPSPMCAHATRINARTRARSCRCCARTRVVEVHMLTLTDRQKPPSSH